MAISNKKDINLIFQYLKELKESYTKSAVLETIREKGRSKKSTSPLNSPKLKANINTIHDIKKFIYQKNPNITPTINSNDLVSFTIKPSWITIKLPNSNYGIKGGTARQILLKILNMPGKNKRPRDIDIVRIGKKNDAKYKKTDIEIAKKYMPEDFKFGFGIEVCPSLREYFSTRDLTVNELLLLKDTLYCSINCLIDTINQFIRPTKYILNGSKAMQEKIAAKSIRFVIESFLDGITYVSFENIELFSRPSAFAILLNLDRIARRGLYAVNSYINICIKLGILPPKYASLTLDEVVLYLNSELKNKNYKINLTYLKEYLKHNKMPLL